MAFFGSDGLEHQLKHVKAQLASKDYEISSVRNELRKKDDELVEARKQRESTSYKLQEEEARAHQAETALKQRTTELANLRLQHDNLQSAHRDQSNKVKAGEKENGRLQYDVDALGATNEEGRRLQQECVALQAKVKDLEKQLCRAKEDHEAFKAEASSSNKATKRPNMDFFGATLSPAPKRGNRRRSTSLSSDNRLSELEAEVESLRSAQGPSSLELDKLKTQLASAKKELDKVTNAKLALERSSAREMEELKSRLEDANFELEDWRRNDGSGSKAGIEKAQKTAKLEVEAMSRKVGELEETIRGHERAMEKLPAYEAEIDSLRTAIEQARSTDNEAPISTPNEGSTELNEKIAELEKELAQARTTALSSAPSADKTSRQLQREIAKLKSQITGLEDELATQDDEILRLRGALPLPGSPSMTATKSSEDIAKIILLEEQLEEAKAQVIELQEKLEIAKEQNEALQKQLETADSDRKSFEAQMAEAKSDLAAKVARVTEVEEEALGAREASASLLEELRLARASAEDAQAVLKDNQQQLDTANKRYTELEAQLAARSDVEGELATAMSSLAEQTRIADDAKAALKQAQLAASDLEASVQNATTQRDTIQAEVQGLKDNVNDLITRLADEEDRSKAAVASAAEKKAYLKGLKEKYKEATIERDGIQLRLAEAQDQLVEVQTRAEEMQDRYEEASKARLEAEASLEQVREEVANRSTESQARERDLELVDQKAELNRVQAALDAQRAEHEKELELAAFAAEQDLQAAKTRLATLEDEVALFAEAKRNLYAASDKIRQLRAERDQLRTTLHFVNHEQRFTSEEAATHRAALDTARLDLDARSAAICKLQSEYDDAKTAHGHVSAELENGLEEAKIARDTSLQQVAVLELRLQDESKQAVSLVNDLRGARDRALHAEIELSKMTKVYKQMEADYDLLKLQLDVKLEAAAKAEREAPAPGSESPKSAAIEGTRQRRVSGLQSPSWDIVVKLKEANASFKDRVERRDVHIRNIENELKQAKVNLQLAQDAAEENMVEFQDRSSEISQKDAALRETREAMDRQAEESRVTLDAMRLRADGFEMDANVNARSLQEVIVALAAAHHTARSNASLRTAGIQSLRAADERLDKIGQMSTSAMASATHKIVQLSEQAQQLEAQLQANVAALSASREQETALRVDLQAQLDAAGVVEADLRRGLGDLETSLAERDTELEVASRRYVELESTLDETRTQHVQLLADAEDRVQARQSEVSELLNKLATADKHRNATEEEAAARHAAVIELEQARSEVESFKKERDTLLENLQELERAQEDLARDHDQQRAQKEEELLLERRSNEERINGFTAELEEKVSEIARLVRVVEELESTVAALRTQMADAEALEVSDKAKIAGLQTQLAEADERVASAESKAAAAAKEIEDVQASLRTAEAAIVTAENASKLLQAEVDSLREARTTLEKELTEAKDTAPAVTPTADSDLQERVNELEGSLTLKVQEVEEAEDRVREALKDKGKLEKKVAKLQRQLAAATATADPETAANTAANKRISQQVVNATPMAPPRRPVPASAPALSALTPKVNAPAPSPRRPLQSVNIIMDVKPSPAGGLKRAREEKVDEKPLPAECILLPPAQLEGATPRSVKAAPRHKPQRTASGEMGTPRTRINIFSGDS